MLPTWRRYWMEFALAGPGPEAVRAHPPNPCCFPDGEKTVIALRGIHRISSCALCGSLPSLMPPVIAAIVDGTRARGKTRLVVTCFTTLNSSRTNPCSDKLTARVLWRLAAEGT